MKEYAWLVDAVRRGSEDAPLEVVLERIITQLPEDFVIKPFLEAHLAEVKGMLLTEYNEAETMRLFREEGRAEGRKEGRAEGKEEGIEIGTMKTLLSLVRQGLLPVGVAAKQAHLSEDAFRRLMEDRTQNLPN